MKKTYGCGPRIRRIGNNNSSNNTQFIDNNRPISDSPRTGFNENSRIYDKFKCNKKCWDPCDWNKGCCWDPCDCKKKCCWDPCDWNKGCCWDPCDCKKKCCWDPCDWNQGFWDNCGCRPEERYYEGNGMMAQFNNEGSYMQGQYYDNYEENYDNFGCNM